MMSRRDLRLFHREQPIILLASSRQWRARAPLPVRWMRVGELRFLARHAQLSGTGTCAGDPRGLLAPDHAPNARLSVLWPTGNHPDVFIFAGSPRAASYGAGTQINGLALAAKHRVAERPHAFAITPIMLRRAEVNPSLAPFLSPASSGRSSCRGGASRVYRSRVALPSRPLRRSKKLERKMPIEHLIARASVETAATRAVSL